MNCEEAFSAESNWSVAELPRSYNILLVDFDSTCLAILTKMLRQCGYLVITARRASDAFCIIKEKDELDLVLAETHLPDMDKYEFLETMREMSNLPVVLMSSDFNENDMLGALFEGAEFYLVKPITINHLKNLWQLSIAKNGHTIASAEGGMTSDLSSDVTENQMFVNEQKQDNGWNVKKKAQKEMEYYEESSTKKKPKMIEAHPNTVLQSMNIPSLKKGRVESHLEKHQQALKHEQGFPGKNVTGGNPISHCADNPDRALFQSPEMQSYDQKNVAGCSLKPPFNEISSFNFSGFHQAVDSNGEELVKGNMGFADLVESGNGNTMQWQTAWTYQPEQQLESQQQKADDAIFRAERVEIDQKKFSPEELLDEDSDDFW